MSILQIKKVFGTKVAASTKSEAKKSVSKKAPVASKVTKTVTATKTTKAPQKVGLVCAEGEQCFWSNDGLVLSSLADLQAALIAMSEDTYSHHVTKEKNDFADWVEFVLIDKQCASDLRKAKGKKAAMAVVAHTLSAYVV